MSATSDAAATAEKRGAGVLLCTDRHAKSVARFRYRLQAALTTFVDRERQALGAHAVARGAHEREVRALAVLDERRSTAHMKFRARDSAAACEFGELDAQLCTLGRARQRQLERVAAAQSRLAETRSALEAARLRKMALERHRERALREFDRFGALRESADLDESNARTFAR